MWKPEYAASRRKKYASDEAERERRKSQGRTPEQNAEYMRKYYAANKHKAKPLTPAQREKRNRDRRKRYAEDPDFRAKIIALVKSRPKHKRREGRIRSAFGITSADYDAMLVLQGGGCAICGSTKSDSRGGHLHVDHCHKTGTIRGLLCGSCNMGIGKFGDDAERLERAATYLRSAQNRSVADEPPADEPDLFANVVEGEE